MADHGRSRPRTNATGLITDGFDRRCFLGVCLLAGASLGSPGCRSAPPRPADSAPAPRLTLDPDNDARALNSSQLRATLGALPKPRRRYQMGAVVKFLGNQYWQLLAEGMQSMADRHGITLDAQGASSEADRAGQLAIMDAMVAKHYDALLISPQTDDNLVPAVEKARKAGVVLVNVDDAVLKDAEHFVGPNQYENGVRAARYFLDRNPQGGRVAVIEGQEGVYAARQRTLGFKNTLAHTRLQVVASVCGDWDLQKSLSASAAIIKQYPDLAGFYCNNDIMALGVVEAVHAADKLGQMAVIGTDGIRPAYESIRAGELTGTVDSFPLLTGQVAVEVALRVLEGQAVPRVVFSPQNLVTLSNIDDPLPR